MVKDRWGLRRAEAFFSRANRVTFETMAADFYTRLGVDPKAERAEIEAALKRKQPNWSMGTRNPKTRHEFQRYLDEIPALKRALLSDAASRAAYDAELEMDRKAEREAKRDLLDRLVRVRAAKGGLTTIDRTRLAEEAGKLGLTNDDVYEATRPIPSLQVVETIVEVERKPDEPSPDVLDPSTRRQIGAALAHLGRRDLYDALGLDRDAPASEIALRADQERQRWMKKTQVTAEKTAWLEVVSHAQSHLGSPQARARYDRTLALESEEAFEKLARFALKDLKQLDGMTRQTLFEEAAALGIPVQRTDHLMAQVQRELGHRAESPLGSSGIMIALANAAQSPAEPKFVLLRCRSCGGVAELSRIARKATMSHCRHCGASLKWDCPICKKNHWVDTRRCSCGFRQALREPVNRHFEAARSAFRAFDLERSLWHLERALKLAPQFEAATSALARVRQRQAAIERARLNFETAMAGGRLWAARSAAESWGRIADPESPELKTAWSRLEKQLLKAESLAGRAHKLERSDPAGARELYRQSLALAADLPSAHAGLARTPPDGPTKLEAHVQGDRIRLSWSPPAPDEFGPYTFVVVRKRGAPLEHPGDGIRIAEISTCDFDDVHAPPGESVSYAVLAKRGGLESVAAVSLGPFLYLADVKDLRVEQHRREVEIHWTPPRGAVEIRVVRKRDTPPRGPRDGDRVIAALDHAMDHEIDPNEICFYGVFAVYRMEDGKLYPSPGSIVMARPRPPVSPLAPPRITRETDGSIRVDWIEPDRGSVKILRVLETFPRAVGDRLSATEVDSLTGRWIETQGPDRAIDPEPPANGACFYVPLTSWGGTWTVGFPSALRHVADPTDLSASRRGGTATTGARVSLRWSWPPAATACMIVTRQGHPPRSPDEPDAIAQFVSRDDYDQQGGYSFILPTPNSRNGHDPSLKAGDPSDPGDRSAWYARVFAVIGYDGDQFLSPGLEPTAATTIPNPHPEISVAYTIHRPWIPGRPWTISLKFEPAGTVLPPMVLVAHPRTVPLAVDDGQIVAKLPSAKNGERLKIRPSADIRGHGTRLFLDPSAHPDDLPSVRFQHPETAHERV